MKLFGHSDFTREDDTVRPTALAEITLNASPAELRSMARFLDDCAAEMDAMGTAYDHVHLSDRIRSFEDSPQFLVARG